MSKLYGVIGVFTEPKLVLAAAKQIHGLGYRNVESFSPFPIEGIEEYVSKTKNPVAAYCLLGGILGALTGFFMQYYANVYDYPLNVGGRPYNSWPAFIPITFELTILFAAFFAVFSMLLLNGFPKPYHPIFHATKFSLGSGAQFCLCIKATDTLFEASRITSLFLENHALATEEIPL